MDALTMDGSWLLICLNYRKRSSTKLGTWIASNNEKFNWKIMGSLVRYCYISGMAGM